MKGIFTFLMAFSFLSSTSVFAQRINLDLGIKLGASFTNINGKYWENGYKANLLGGAFLGVNGSRLGGQIEGIFSQATYITGNDFSDVYGSLYNNIGDSVKKGSFKVNYLSIPVLLNLRLFNRAIIQLGPQYSGIVSVDDKDELVKDATELFANGSIDGVVGLWIKLPLRLNIGARYIFGLSDINKVDPSAIEDSWKQRSLQVHVGYSIF